MSFEIYISYAVYNLRTYFSRQPEDIRCCPICGDSLSKSDIDPSKKIANDISFFYNLIPVHDFSRLYVCGACHWWGVWESWGLHEINNCDFDYLIASVADGKRKVIVTTDKQASPWSQVLEDEYVYDSAMPLPDALGRLFVGGAKESVSHASQLPTDLIAHFGSHLSGTQNQEQRRLDRCACGSGKRYKHCHGKL